VNGLKNGCTLFDKAVLNVYKQKPRYAKE